MIDHVSVGVRDLVRARAFYDAVLAALGFELLMDVGVACGYGPKGGAPGFWLGLADPALRPGAGPHVALLAGSRAAVNAFHAAAMAAGATDNGAPGLRPHYHPDYYGAFFIDADGNRLEAVCHRPA